MSSVQVVDLFAARASTDFTVVDSGVPGPPVVLGRWAFRRTVLSETEIRVDTPATGQIVHVHDNALDTVIDALVAARDARDRQRAFEADTVPVPTPTGRSLWVTDLPGRFSPALVDDEPCDDDGPVAA